MMIAPGIYILKRTRVMWSSSRQLSCPICPITGESAIRRSPDSHPHEQREEIEILLLMFDVRDIHRCELTMEYTTFCTSHSKDFCVKAELIAASPRSGRDRVLIHHASSSSPPMESLLQFIKTRQLLLPEQFARKLFSGSGQLTNEWAIAAQSLPKIISCGRSGCQIAPEVQERDNFQVDVAAAADNGGGVGGHLRLL